MQKTCFSAIITPSRIGIGCLAMVLFGGLAFAALNWLLFGTHLQAGFHLKSLETLPLDASDISFAYNRNIADTYACEFRISRSAFEKFALRKGWNLKTIINSDYESIPRYTFVLPEGHPERQKPFMAHVESGFSFESSDSLTQVLYDDRAHRAYLFSTIR
jgi:hypothetical protein